MAALSASSTACSTAPGEGTIVATVYPVAFAAEHLARPGAEVIDLTPPGSEAHDLELSLEARATMEDADMVIYLGNIGFQPQVESAVEELDTRVVDLSLELDRVDGIVDPHFWLEPSYFSTIVRALGGEFCPSEDPCSSRDAGTRDAFLRRLGELQRRYGEGLHECTYDTLIVPHQAF
ncbi:MAG: metal ABC transporter substrate-binding protein, partial [Actinomycetota bacterium]